ncbi:phage head morphogenesis protein [Thermophagus sp. OGC60D27]|uniref:phage head morphogenesis protein n=1 Tax=Thermophagus sp. OGC60D27 TaxID=3458415 RepID=UPI004037DB56
MTEQYNKNWLRTEYDQALSSAEMAKKWNGFIADKDLYPNLEYVAVMDSQTRNSHAALNGTIRPIDDPFWDSHYPPNGWGCRCDVVQTDKPANKAPDLTPDKGFNNNPGKRGKLFSDDAGYYDVTKEEMNEVNQHANELLKANIIKEATEILTNKFVRSGNLKIAFSEKGIKTTASINKKTKAMALLLNNDNIQQLIDAAEKHIVKGNVHIWTGEDAGISFEIKATETTTGTLIFDYVKIK